MSKWPLAQARESGVSPALLTVPVHAHMHALVCVCIPFYSGNIIIALGIPQHSTFMHEAIVGVIHMYVRTMITYFLDHNDARSQGT